jgi:hypothetical protein
MLRHLKDLRRQDPVDVILITGDLIGHMNNNKRRNLPNWDADKFTLMMQTHQQLAQMAHE